MTDYSDTYDPDGDFDRWFTLFTGRRIRGWLRPGDRVLELGAATGLMTSVLAEAEVTIDAVDRSRPYLERLEARGLPGVTTRIGDLEALQDSPTYDHVVATNLLHELSAPAAFLAACRDRLEPGGMLHVSVPNPRSIHRLVAVELGLIERLDTPSERAVRWENRGVVAAEEVLAMATEAGLRCPHRDGVLLKPLTNAQMAELPESVIEGLDRAARHLPDVCGMNYFVLMRA